MSKKELENYPGKLAGIDYPVMRRADFPFKEGMVTLTYPSPLKERQLKILDEWWNLVRQAMDSTAELAERRAESSKETPYDDPQD